MNHQRGSRHGCQTLGAVAGGQDGSQLTNKAGRIKLAVI